MSLNPILTFVAILLAAASLFYYCRIQVIADTKPRPPGPKGHWLIGNLLDIPRTVDWDSLALWKRTYGDIVYLSAFGYSILFLNSAKAISDLLDKRGHIYSHRPIFVMAGELMGLGKSMALIDYGAQYKRQRKFTQQALNTDAIRKYHPYQENITLRYMRSLLDKPDDFMEELRLTIGRMILAITYGLSVETSDSEYIADAESTMTMIGKSTLPGAYLVDLIPALKYLPPWLPFTSFLEEAKNGHSQIYNFVSRPFEFVKRQMEAGSAPPSLVADLLVNKNVPGDEDQYDEEEDIKWVAGTMYGGGMESSFSTICVFFLLMARHPEKQAKAQAEVDRAIGGERLVMIENKDQLPYVQALIKEVMRWHVVVPMGIARRTAQDDEYQGYHIPANTVVIPNVWGLSRLDDDHESSTSFMPERFLSKDKPANPSDYVFGFGRRVCPGKYLAENSIFLLVSNILALFNIMPPSKERSPSNAKSPFIDSFTRHLVSCPEKFDCDIRPRSVECAALIEQAFDVYGL